MLAGDRAGGGAGRSRPAKPARMRRACRSFKYRHALRIRAGFAGRDLPAPPPARSPASIPRSAGALVPTHFRCPLRRADDRTDRDHLAEILRLADDWVGDLYLLQPPA